jgi:hypothetical protein
MRGEGETVWQTPGSRRGQRETRHTRSTRHRGGGYLPRPGDLGDRQVLHFASGDST